MTQPDRADTVAQLRQRIADAIRQAACEGDCDQTEEECAKQRIQPFVWHFGVLAEVSGPIDAIAAAVLAAVQPEMDAHEQLHHQLADSLGRSISTPWGDLITAAFRAYRAADLLSGAERERQEAEAALARVRDLAADIDDRNWQAPGTEVAARIRLALEGPTEGMGNASYPSDGGQG